MKFKDVSILCTECYNSLPHSINIFEEDDTAQLMVSSCPFCLKKEFFDKKFKEIESAEEELEVTWENLQIDVGNLTCSVAEYKEAIEDMFLTHEGDADAKEVEITFGN
jgi:hypothetical protein